SMALQMLLISAAVILILGVILSYTRAAWVSLVAAFGVYLILKLRIQFKVVFAGMALLVGLYFVYQDQILSRFEKNETESSSELTDHVESISNISSDASNLERINRWNSALRMFMVKPIFGFGPGTYMFQYAPFQRADEKTIISTNFGEVGNAHSEYLGPLSESGFMGMLAFVALLIVILRLGLNLYYQLEPGKTRDLVLAMLLGLITYFVHGVLNNYLDTDKASVPFWTFIAGLVAIDLWHKKNSLKKEEATAE
ncbi:MAG: O-antigen ligase family protein, partial [Luteibaculum sp.]